MCVIVYVNVCPAVHPVNKSPKLKSLNANSDLISRPPCLSLGEQKQRNAQTLTSRFLCQPDGAWWAAKRGVGEGGEGTCIGAPAAGQGKGRSCHIVASSGRTVGTWPSRSGSWRPKHQNRGHKGGAGRGGAGMYARRRGVAAAAVGGKVELFGMPPGVLVGHDRLPTVFLFFLRRSKQSISCDLPPADERRASPAAPARPGQAPTGSP